MTCGVAWPLLKGEWSPCGEQPPAPTYHTAGTPAPPRHAAGGRRRRRSPIPFSFFWNLDSPSLYSTLIMTLFILIITTSTLIFFARAKTLVVGSGPGGTGFILRAVELDHASSDTFEWFEEGDYNDAVLDIIDWPKAYNIPGSERYIKLIDTKEGQAGPGLPLKAIRFTAFGGGAVLNSGGPLTLMDSDDERIQVAVERYGSQFLAEELKSQALSTDQESDRMMEWYDNIGYEVESDFLTTRKAGQANRVGYAASSLSVSRDERRQRAADLVSDYPNRINLHLQTRVKRVVFGPSRHAIGIELMNGTTVKGDIVVLAGGVFGTYELLVRSGIGSKRDLETLGVDEVVADESVGKQIGDDAGILFFHGGREVHEPDGTWRPGIVASHGTDFGITHGAKQFSIYCSLELITGRQIARHMICYVPRRKTHH